MPADPAILDDLIARLAAAKPTRHDGKVIFPDDRCGGEPIFVAPPQPIEWEAAEAIRSLRAEIATLRQAALAETPREPPPGLLMSMAIRYDHGLGAPGYYDQEIFKITKQPSHAQRLACTLTTMRQLWEEVAGTGFYSPAREAEYVALRDRALPRQTEEHGGAS